MNNGGLLYLTSSLKSSESSYEESRWYIVCIMSET